MERAADKANVERAAAERANGEIATAEKANKVISAPFSTHTMPTKHGPHAYFCQPSAWIFDPGKTSVTTPPLTDVTTLGSSAAQLSLRLAVDQVAGVPPLTEDQVAGVPPLTEDQVAGMPPMLEDQAAAYRSLLPCTPSTEE